MFLGSTGLCGCSQNAKQHGGFSLLFSDYCIEAKVAEVTRRKHTQNGCQRKLHAQRTTFCTDDLYEERDLSEPRTFEDIDYHIPLGTLLR